MLARRGRTCFGVAVSLPSLNLRLRHRRNATKALLVVLSLAGTLSALTVQISAAGATSTSGSRNNSRVPTHCSWVEQSLRHSATPASLANEVLSRMTLSEKLNFVVLHSGNGVENSNYGIASLCIPPLTLSDGPNGVAAQASGVTQLPAAIGVAASFDPTVAFATGTVTGAEARTKGIDVVQGPELNLARVRESGRIFESFGEDPFLTSVLGVATINGIQSQGELAMAKHFSAYTQETARSRLQQVIPLRALAELYNAPFEAAVKVGHVASVMCSIGVLNGVRDCADPYIYSTLRSWGFSGFIRSDLRAVPDVAKAINAGLDLFKPVSTIYLSGLVHSRKLRMRSLDRAVRAMLTQMFKFGLIARPRVLAMMRTAYESSHALIALRAAEQSVVLLKNHRAILPLSRKITSIAVIGVDAGPRPLTSGGGSSAVSAPFVVSPLAALRSSLGPRVAVRYESGTPTTLDLDELNDADIAGSPVRGATLAANRRSRDLFISRASNVTNAIATAVAPGTGKGWSHWRLVIRAHRTGVFEVSSQGFGDTWFFLNGRPLLSSPGIHGPTTMATTVRLRAGQRYTFSARWFSEIHQGPPRFGIVNITHQLNAAAALARRSNVAIVFASEYSSEGADHPTLSLSGDQNALIAAVANANPRTVVVLNTGGAVTMPWLDHVAAVVEAWYPGEQDGAAIAAVLRGAIDPSGRLPITFPTSSSALPSSSPQQYPGVNSVVNFGTSTSSLDIGYRWYQVNGVKPLFPFGFGLDYTSFKLSHGTVRHGAAGVVVHLTVSNTGLRSGADVVQVYVQFPRSAREPPEQLRAITRLVLAPSVSRSVSMLIPWSEFHIYHRGSFEIIHGDYGINVGQSSANLTLHLRVKIE